MLWSAGGGAVKTFFLDRTQDESGVSGTGRVAQGVQFDDGVCVLRWMTEHRSTAIYNSIEELEKIHGHNGRTQVVWSNSALDLASIFLPRLEKGFEGDFSDYACEHNCGPALPGARERYEKIQRIDAPVDWYATSSWFVSGQICLRISSPEIFVESIRNETNTGPVSGDYYTREVATFCVDAEGIRSVPGMGVQNYGYAVFVDGVPGRVYTELYYR